MTSYSRLAVTLLIVSSAISGKVGILFEGMGHRTELTNK